MSYQSHKRCVACRHWGEGEQCYHHLYTRGARPDLSDEPWNKISVCLKCHNLFHSKHTNWMAKEFTDVYFWLIKNGWQRCPIYNEWYNIKAILGGADRFPTYEPSND